MPSHAWIRFDRVRWLLVMTDIIRKAVELADGWALVEKWGRPYALFAPNTRALDCKITCVRDALAAQLTRQVDALDNAWVDAYPGWTAVRDGDIYSVKRDLGASYSSDRTLNTIKAIVESKVLDQGDD